MKVKWKFECKNNVGYLGNVGNDDMAEKTNKEPVHTEECATFLRFTRAAYWVTLTFLPRVRYDQ